MTTTDTQQPTLSEVVDAVLAKQYRLARTYGGPERGSWGVVPFLPGMLTMAGAIALAVVVLKHFA